MNLMRLPQLYRNARRWREILAVLSKRGLADLVERLGVVLQLSEESSLSGSREERVRLAFEELGPTFIKLGQVLATRPDLVGVEMAEELSKLQTSAPADPPEAIRQIIEAELGATIEERFTSFELEPVASGSIGQVHRAVLADGKQVAVKVRHEGIKPQVQADTEILLGLAELAEGVADLKSYRPKAIVEEFERTLRRELDFESELRRIEQFRRAFAKDDRITIPEPHPQLSTGRVLTVDWIEGRKLSGPPLIDDPPGELARVARNGAEVFLEMIFDHGLYHADPHPGNLLVLPGGVLGLLDFGMVGHVSERLREDLEDVLISVAANDAEGLTAALLRVGEGSALLDREALLRDLVDFVDQYGYQQVSQFDLSGALTELFRIVRRRGLILSPQMAMLLKLMILLEGSARRLAPDFSLLDVVAPMKGRLMLRRLSPTRQAKRLHRLLGEVELLAEEAPRGLRELLRQAQSGRFEVHLDHRGLEPSVNRLVLGLVTSAMIVGGSLMLSRGVLPLWGVSMPGAAAFGLSGLLGLRLWRAIRKSGWLDTR